MMEGPRLTASTTALKELEPTFLKELVLWKTSYGKYIKITYVSEPIESKGIEGRCSDDNNDEIQVTISGIKSKDNNFFKYFQKGTVIYVKERFYKLPNKGGHLLKIDDSKDVYLGDDPEVVALLKPYKVEVGQVADTGKDEEYRL